VTTTASVLAARRRRKIRERTYEPEYLEMLRQYLELAKAAVPKAGE
jgi:hypothetical protein